MVTLWPRDLAREPRDEAGQAAARAVGKPQDVDRRLHRGGRDVDDAAELARDHAVDRGLDQLDRRQHVGVDARAARRRGPSRGNRPAAGRRRC